MKKNEQKGKRKRSNWVLKQKALYPQKKKTNKLSENTHKTVPKQRLQSDSGRSVGVNTITKLVWRNRFDLFKSLVIKRTRNSTNLLYNSSSSPARLSVRRIIPHTICTPGILWSQSYKIRRRTRLCDGNVGNIYQGSLRLRSTNVTFLTDNFSSWKKIHFC